MTNEEFWAEEGPSARYARDELLKAGIIETYFRRTDNSSKEEIAGYDFPEQFSFRQNFEIGFKGQRGIYTIRRRSYPDPSLAVSLLPVVSLLPPVGADAPVSIYPETQIVDQRGAIWLDVSGAIIAADSGSPQKTGP
jgi:hypothetical protein